MIRSLMIALTAMMATAAFGATPTAPWNEKITLSGDLRFRHDYISKLRQFSQAADHRDRFRVRIKMDVKVNETSDLHVRLTTAENNVANSANNSMTDNASRKPVNFDMAFLDYKLADETHIFLGKQDNPLYLLPQSQSMFDSDYMPEGFALVHKGEWFTTLAAYSLQIRRPDVQGHSEPDSWLLSGLAGYKSSSHDGFGMMAAAGYHDFTSLKNNAGLAWSANAKNLFLGNSSYNGTDDNGRYAHDYKVGEALAEVHWKSSDLMLLAFADFLHNFDVDHHNQALWTGVAFSTLDEHQHADWTLGYTYITQEKDATVSAMNFSDFGNGIDGANGHLITIQKALPDRASARLLLMHAKVDDLGTPFDTDRAIADLAFSF